MLNSLIFMYCTALHVLSLAIVELSSAGEDASLGRGCCGRGAGGCRWCGQRPEEPQEGDGDPQLASALLPGLGQHGGACQVSTSDHTFSHLNRASTLAGFTTIFPFRMLTTRTLGGATSMTQEQTCMRGWMMFRSRLYSFHEPISCQRKPLCYYSQRRVCHHGSNNPNG